MEQSVTDEILAGVQQQMFDKARNYIGHNVWLHKGVVQI